MTIRQRIAMVVMVGLCTMAGFFIVHGTLSDTWADLGTDRFYPLSFLGFVVVGAYSIIRRPKQRIGWVMAGIGVGISVAVTGDTYVVPLFPESWQPWVALLGQSVFVMGFGALVPLFFLWYPTGYVPSPRWIWIQRSIVFLSVMLAGYYAIRPGVTSDLGLENPIGWQPLAFLRDGPVESAVGQALVVLALAAVASLFVRFRRGTWEVRQQIRLVLYPTYLFIALFLIFAFALDSLFDGTGDPVPIVFVIGLNGIAIGVGVAIARYRLFEVDRLIARTVSYALIVGLLALVFAVGVVWIPEALGLGESPLLVAATTLLAAALFAPLRRRIQSAVDRRFNRAKYDAESVVDEFASTLRDEIDVSELVAGWRGVVSKTMQPAAIGVWTKTP